MHGNRQSSHDQSADKREHTRFKVQENLFALLETDAERQPALVVNVGKGGVCLHYFRNNCSCNWRKLTISSFHADCYLGQLPVEIVYDRPATKAGDAPSNGMRRCGVRFSHPTYTQQALWDIFIARHATTINGKEPPEF